MEETQRYSVRGFAVIEDGYTITPSEIARLLNSYEATKEQMRNAAQAQREVLEVEHQRALKAEAEVERQKAIYAELLAQGQKTMLDYLRVEKERDAWERRARELESLCADRL